MPYTNKGILKNRKANNGIPIKLLIYLIQKICLVAIGKVNNNSKSFVEYISLNTCGTPSNIIEPTTNKNAYESTLVKTDSEISSLNDQIPLDKKYKRTAKTINPKI